eukprot:6208986-Pleurochrysis_carterae.AAC.1
METKHSNHHARAEWRPQCPMNWASPMLVVACTGRHAVLARAPHAHAPVGCRCRAAVRSPVVDSRRQQKRRDSNAALFDARAQLTSCRLFQKRSAVAM